MSDSSMPQNSTQSSFFTLRFIVIAVGVVILAYGIIMSFGIGIAALPIGLGFFLVVVGVCYGWRR